MVNASTEFKTAVANGVAKFLAQITVTLTNNTVLNFDNTKIWASTTSIEDAVSADSDFQIGTAIINRFRFTINNSSDAYSSYDFSNAKVVAKTALTLQSGNVEALGKGTFIVDEATYNGTLIELECIDYMSKFDKPFSLANVTFPSTVGEVVRSCCTACGVILGTSTFPHMDCVLNTYDEIDASTCREAIAWCAQIVGRNARCNTSGQLELKWYDFTSLENVITAMDNGRTPDYSNVHQIRHTFSHNVSVDDVVITGVQITVKRKTDNANEPQTYTAKRGTDGYVVSITNNPFLTTANVETVISWLATQLIGLKFRKANISHISDPTIEAGDVAVFFDRNGNYYPIVVSKTVFNLNDSQTTVSSAQTPARNSASRFSADTKNYVLLRKQLQSEKTEREAMYEDLEGKLNSHSGLYSTIDATQSGSIYYLHDKESLTDSKVVWKMTTEAWGVTTEYNGEHPDQTVWNGGMTVNGDVIARYLSADGINAGWIKTGALEISKTVDGVKTTTFYANVDTGVVRIVADSFSLSGSGTIQDIVNNALNSYSPSDNLTQTEIFNILTGGTKTTPGTAQGIWLNNGKVYLNFSYAQGGTLRLGTASASVTDEDSYGILEVYSKNVLQFRLQGVGFDSFDANGYTRVHINSSTLDFLSGGSNILSSSVYCDNNIYYKGTVWSASQGSNLYMEVSTTGAINLTSAQGGMLFKATNGGNIVMNVSSTATTGKVRVIGTFESTENVKVDKKVTCENLAVTNPPWSSSDARLKTNIHSIESQADRIAKLNVRSFDWIKDKRHVGAGLIAQEMQKVFPELVTEGDDGYLLVSYVGLIPYMLKAMQEQSDEIKRLKEALLERGIAYGC